MSGEIAGAVWRASATKRLAMMRKMITQECWPDHLWPIWIHGRELGFPGDDSRAPIEPAANDQRFTIIR